MEWYMSSSNTMRVSILLGETRENAGRPQGSPLHVEFHEHGEETRAVSLFPPKGWRPHNAGLRPSEETRENAGRPQGSPLHVGFHERVGETLAVSLFPSGRLDTP